MNFSTTQLRALGSVMYFAAFVLLANTFTDFVVKAWPFKISELNWRAGAAGLVMEILLSAVVPFMIFFFSAFINNDRKVLQFARWVMLATGILVFGLLAFFAIDSIQLSATLPQNLKGVFIKAALKATLQALMSGVIYIWFGLTVGKVLKSAGVARGADSKEGMLMVGREAAPSRPNLRAIDATEKKKEGTGGLSLDM